MPIVSVNGGLSKSCLVSRKSLNQKKYIWNWDSKDNILKELKKDQDCLLLTHEQALKEMSRPEWKSKDEELLTAEK